MVRPCGLSREVHPRSLDASSPTLTVPSRRGSLRTRQRRLVVRIDVDRHLVRLAHESLDGEYGDVRRPKVEVRAADFLEGGVLHRAGGIEQSQMRTALLNAQRRALEILTHERLGGGIHLEEP